MLADLATAAAVRGALKAQAATSEVNIDINAHQGEVVLRGIVLNEQERVDASRIAAAVTGVAKVDNQLRLMTVTRRFADAKT